MPNPNPNQRDQYVLTTLPSKTPPPSRSKDPDPDPDPDFDLNLDLDPDSDASLLRQHLQDNEEQEVDRDHSHHHHHLNTDHTQAGPGIFRALRAFMSLEPLLPQSISTRETGSYGTATEALESEQADGKIGKSSALGTASAGEGSQSRRHRQENAPVTHDKRKAQESKIIPSDGLRRSGTGRRRPSDDYAMSDDEHERSGDEAIDVDGNHPKWTDANPPDDSP